MLNYLCSQQKYDMEKKKPGTKKHRMYYPSLRSSRTCRIIYDDRNQSRHFYVLWEWNGKRHEGTFWSREMVKVFVT